MGCVDGQGQPSNVADPIPSGSGLFAGRYQVPTDASLAAAAQYELKDVDWIVAGTAIQLHYKLPIGLVGGRVDVTFSGTLTPGANAIELAGANGTGACVARGTIVSCHEVFAGLGALPISMAEVEAAAALEYAGPVSDRVAVANLFGSDPIGIVELDLAVPVIDDHGGGQH